MRELPRIAVRESRMWIDEREYAYGCIALARDREHSMVLVCAPSSVKF